MTDNDNDSYLCDTLSSPARHRQYSSVVVVAWAAQLLHSWFLTITIVFFLLDSLTILDT